MVDFMKKYNSKGFVLAETLIVSVFIMTLFMMFYTNLYPLIGEYERRNSYDDITSKYTAHFIRKMVLASGNSTLLTGNQNYIDITDCPSTYFSNTTMCYAYKEKYHIEKMYVTKFHIESFKTMVKSSNLSRGLKEYVEYLPNFQTPSNKQSYKRVIVEIKHPNGNVSYGTIELISR